MRTLVIILSVFTVIGCKQKSNSEVAEEVVDIPEEFVGFYEQFHMDSIYQMNHIVFPVSGKTDTSKWLKSEWKIHKPFNDLGGTYVREFDNFAGIITENIQDTRGTVSIIRRFAKIGDNYNLIYYSLVTSLEGWSEEGQE